MPQTIRLLHTESSLAMGGQEMRILTEMEKLAAFGYSSLLAAPRGSAINAEARHRGLPVRDVAFRGSFDPQSVWRIARILRLEGIHVVNAHGSKDAWNSSLPARLLGRRIVRARHVGNPIRSGKIARLIYGPLCDRIVVTSEAIARGMREKGVRAKRIDCVPTGIDVDKFASAARTGDFRREYGVAPDAPLVGMVSVLRGDKGPREFIRAATLLAGSGSPAFFALVGDGPRRAELEAMIREAHLQERVIMPGHRRNIAEILKEFTVAVVPSTQTDGIPQAILQAFAAGAPLVASDVGGVNEVAKHGETAWCVPAKSAEALAEGIATVLSDGTLRARLTEEALKLVGSRFSEQSMLKRMDAIYRSLLV